MSTMILFTLILSSCLIFISYLLSHKSNFPVQLGIVNDEGERKSQYECGLETFEEEIGIETRERFTLTGQFYFIGILFLIFDLETLLLYPITLLFYNHPLNDSFLSAYNPILTIYFVFLIFISILLLGLFYEYRKKVI